jgi:hypothetical protein
MDEEQPVSERATRVTIVDVEISFLDLVTFLVKLSLACIPAAIIVLVLFSIVGRVIGGWPT